MRLLLLCRSIDNRGSKSSSPFSSVVSMPGKRVQFDWGAG